MSASLISRILYWQLFVLLWLVHRSFGDEFSALELSRSRLLSAATLRSKLESRDAPLSLLKRETTFDFIESRINGRAAPDGSIFTASVLVRSQKPILSLEDIESDLQRITCFPGEIKLYFSSIDALDRVRKEIEQLSHLVVVSSHLNCNEEDQRAPHIITKVIVSRETMIITLLESSCEWKDAFSMMEVSFARIPSSQILERRDMILQKRQETSSFSSSAQPAPTRAFPDGPQSTSSVPASSKARIDVKVVDQVVIPPQIPGASALVPEGVELTCKNCTIGGELELSQGSFKLEDPDNPIKFLDNTIAFFQHGSVRVDVDGLFGHFELKTKLDLAAGNALNFSVPLPEFPITPFMIPGIVAFGPIFRPQIEMSLALKQPLEFEYGFNVSVPNDASFTIDIGELNNSTATGFDNTKFSTLPFQAQMPASLEFTISFTPEILLGVTSLIGSTTGGVGAFFNIPSLTVKVDQLKGVDGRCNALPSSTAHPGGDKGKGKNHIATLEDLVGDFINIVPSVELNVGVLAELEVGVGTLKEQLEAEHTIASKQFALPTACLAFDKEKKSFASPTPPPPPNPSPPAAPGPLDTRARPPTLGKGGAMSVFGDVEGVRIVLWTCLFGTMVTVAGVL
ncbi:hypothetical protein PABG_06010 [Paracoccidioides brasiliensis Pb03]|nr:hypothetical protein PABG_06010 [Paracoccidioides brasiliensis Pb03]